MNGMNSQPKPQKIPWYLLLIFSFLLVGILLTGYIYYRHQVAHIKRNSQEYLMAILKLKTEQIVYWREERLDDAHLIFTDQFLALRINDYLQGKGTPALKQEILNRLAALMVYQYQKILLIGGQGEVELSFPPERRLDPYNQKLVAEAMRSKEIIFSDLYREEVSHEIRLGLFVPILLPNHKAPVGVVILRIDPHQFLFPLIQTWPTPSRTAETVLLRKEDGEVVFLNELRDRQGSPLTLRLPLDAPDLCAAKVARGVVGVMEGKDYRGQEVLAAGGRIPDSPWFLLAKEDQQEIFAPIADLARHTILLQLALVVSVGLGLAYVWRNQQAAYYRGQFETERDKSILARRYAYLVKYANDIILLADQDLRLLEANDLAVESYGYGKDELLRMSLQDLHPAETRPILAEKLQEVERSEGLLFETSQQRKDGSTFPVEISLNLLEMEGQKVYQEIIRDVTKRKASAEALRESEKSLRHLTEQLLTAQETERQRISLLLHDELGQALMLFKFQLSAIEDNLQKAKSPQANDCLELLQYLDGLINKIRQLSRDLNPPGVLEEMGFQGALKYLIEEISKHFQIKARKVAIDEIEPLFSQEALVNIYRIFQECLTNIGRHAQASQISIKVKKKEDQVSFMIQDNGRGFDMGQIMGQNGLKPGLGLPSIEERVRILGGSISIKSKPGAGTKISFNLPIK